MRKPSQAVCQVNRRDLSQYGENGTLRRPAEYLPKFLSKSKQKMAPGSIISFLIDVISLSHNLETLLAVVTTSHRPRQLSIMSDILQVVLLPFPFQFRKVLGYELNIPASPRPVIRRISQGRFCSIAFAFRVSLLYYKGLRF